MKSTEMSSEPVRHRRLVCSPKPQLMIGMLFLGPNDISIRDVDAVIPVLGSQGLPRSGSKHKLEFGR